MSPIFVSHSSKNNALAAELQAILHAAKAALHIHDVSVASHAAVRRMFGMHLIRSGQIEPEWSAYLIESLDDRIAADYDVETDFSKKDAQEECRRSREFLSRIRRYLLKKGLKERELR